MWIYFKLQNITIAKINANLGQGMNLFGIEVYPNGNIDVDEKKIKAHEIYRKDLLPLFFRGKVISDSYDFYYALMDFLKYRFIKDGRYNSKYLMGQFGFTYSRDTDFLEKYLIVKALSASDDYWLTYNEDEDWNSINPRQNISDERLMKQAVKRVSYFLPDGKIISPEYSGSGSSRRCWQLDKENNVLYLNHFNYTDKYSHSINSADTLILISKLIENLNLNKVTYIPVSLDICGNIETAAGCKCFSGDDEGFVSGMELFLYGKDISEDYTDLVLNLDEENVYKQVILNYILGRDNEKIGAMMDNKTGNLTRLSPYYGYTKCFEDTVFAEDIGMENLDKNKIKKYLKDLNLELLNFPILKEDKKEFIKNRIKNIINL